jgi:1-deoxy-D-xylulose-5-phosphate synthase
MGTVCARYPFVIPFHSQTLTRRLDCSISQFPLSRITLYSSSSRILIHRVCARPDIDDFYWEKVPTPILDTVQNPLCLKNLSQQELKQLAAEIRLELSSILSGTQILLNPSMAVVDLTVAISKIFLLLISNFALCSGKLCRLLILFFSKHSMKKTNQLVCYLSADVCT